MELTNISTDDDAVSPVIGVILMVAITVILAAVIATFVIGIGDQNQASQPSTTLSFDYEQDEGNVSISHSGGETLEAQNLYVRGDGFNESTILTNKVYANAPDSWTELSNDYGEGSKISSANSIDVAVNSSYDITVVWEPPSGENSYEIGEDQGPDA